MSLYLGTNLISGAQDISGKANTSLDNLNATGRGIINGKASTSLDNLTSTGKNIGNWSSNVTNCITEIPQKINVELNNGTFTLVKGSKLYVPAGFQQDGVTPKFNTVTINSYIDYSQASTDTKTRLLFYRSGTLQAYEYSQSGSSGPSGSGWIMYYDIAENLVKLYSDGDEMYSGYSLPIAQVTADGSHIVGKINQIFNGFGYIGSTVFALPGVKGLIPNGRNEDGTLNSTEYTVASVITATYTSTENGVEIAVVNDGSFTKGTFFKLGSDGYLYNNAGVKKSAFVFASCKLTSGVISNFNPKTVFHSLDWNDKGTIAGFGMPSNTYIDYNTSERSFIAPANGYYNAVASMGTNSNLRWNNTSNGMIVNYMNSQVDTRDMGVCIPVKKGDSLTLNVVNVTSVKKIRFIYAGGEI